MSPLNMNDYQDRIFPKITGLNPSVLTETRDNTDFKIILHNTSTEPTKYTDPNGKTVTLVNVENNPSGGHATITKLGTDASKPDASKPIVRFIGADGPKTIEEALAIVAGAKDDNNTSKLTLNTMPPPATDPIVNELRGTPPPSLTI